MSHASTPLPQFSLLSTLLPLLRLLHLVPLPVPLLVLMITSQNYYCSYSDINIALASFTLDLSFFALPWRYIFTSSLACDLSVGSDSSILTNSVNTCGSALILSSITLSKDTVLTLAMWTWFMASAREAAEMMDLAYSLLAMLGKLC